MNEREYGLLNLFLLYSGIFAIILNLGVSRSFAYLYWDVYKSEKKLKSLISSTVTLLLMLQLILITLSIFSGESIVSLITKSEGEFTYFPYFVLSVFYSCFMVYYEMFQFFFRNRENLKLYSILTVSTLILFTLGNLIGVVFLELKSVGAIYGRTISYGIVSISFLSYFIKKYGLAFDSSVFKSILIFGFPLFINSLIGAVAYGFDKFLIEHLDFLENLGIYGFALIAVTVLEIYFNAINNAFTPTIFRYLKESFREKGEVIESIVFFIIISVMLLAVIIIGLFYPMLELFIPENYHLAGKYVPIIVCAFFWRVLTGIKSFSLFKEKKTKYFLLNQSSILLSISLIGYYGYQYFGIMGIIYAVYCSKFIEYIIMSAISNRVSKLPIRFRSLTFMIILISVSAFFISQFDYRDSKIYLIYTIPLFIFVVTAPFLLRKEFQIISNLIKTRKEVF